MTPQHWRQRVPPMAQRMARQLAQQLATVAACALAGLAQAELPVETVSATVLPPQDAHRVYLSDPVLGHLVDGRTHVIDGNTMRYLGLVGTGFAGASTLSRDGKTFYVATSYNSRLQRGTRTDVVEVYGTDDLVLRHEILIPTKRAQSLPMKALLATTADSRFLLIQNATPATSVTVVDLLAQKVTADIPIPGCYGAIAWPKHPRRFSSICGDGSLATFELDEQGSAVTAQAPLRFFDPDVDPVYVHYEQVEDRLLLLSFLGQVHTLTLAGEQASAAAPWSILDTATRKHNWRPGGYQLFAVEPRTQRLFVGMHSKGAEGTHKNPAEEIWVVDLAAQKRIARVPGEAALGMVMSKADKPRLFVLSAINNRVLAYDPTVKTIQAKKYKPLIASAPIGETPIFLSLP